MEPDWDDLERRLGALLVRELRQIGREHFNGMLGGESTKAGIACEMASQMRHWWRACGDEGKARVRHVMAAIKLAEER